MIATLGRFGLGMLASLASLVLYRLLWRTPQRFVGIRFLVALLPLAMLVSSGLMPQGRWKWLFILAFGAVLTIAVLRYTRPWGSARYNPDAGKERRSPINLTGDRGVELVDVIDAQFQGSTRPAPDGAQPRPGRCAHAHGTGVAATFTPTPEAASLTSAPIFQPGRWKAYVRFSNSDSRTTRQDSQPDVHGMTVRITVPATEQKTSSRDVAVDFVSIDIDRFIAADMDSFVAVTRAITQLQTPGRHLLERLTGLGWLIVHTAVGRTSPVALRQTSRPQRYTDQTYHGVHTFWWSKDGVRRPVRYRWVPDVEREAWYKLLPSMVGGSVLGIFRFGRALLVGPPDPKTSKDLDDAIRKWPLPAYRLEVVHGDRLPDWRLNNALLPYPKRSNSTVVGRLDFSPNSMQSLDAWAFSPINVCEGIDPSDDEILAARLAAYPVSVERRLAAKQVSKP